MIAFGSDIRSEATGPGVIPAGSVMLLGWNIGLMRDPSGNKT